MEQIQDLHTRVNISYYSREGDSRFASVDSQRAPFYLEPVPLSENMYRAWAAPAQRTNLNATSLHTNATVAPPYVPMANQLVYNKDLGNILKVFGLPMKHKAPGSTGVRIRNGVHRLLVSTHEELRTVREVIQMAANSQPVEPEKHEKAKLDEARGATGSAQGGGAVGEAARQ